MSLFPPSVYHLPRRKRRELRAIRRIIKLDPVEYQIDLVGRSFVSYSTTWSEPTLFKGCVLIDSSKFVNPAYYFEVVLSIDNAIATASAHLVDQGTSDVCNGGTEVTGSVLSTQSTDPVRLRSGALSLTSGHRFRVQIKTDNINYGANIWAGRIIVQDNISAGWTKGEEAVELGDFESYTPATANLWKTVAEHPIYKYETSPRDGTLTAYFEACLGCGTAGKTVKARLIGHSNPDLSDAGTALTGSEVSVAPASADVLVRVRSSIITMTDGKYYAVQITCASAGRTVHLSLAKIIIQQSGTITKTQLHKKIATYRYLAAGDVWSLRKQQIYLDKSKLPSNQTYYYQGIIHTSNASYLAQTDLYNITDSVSVTDSALGTYSVPYIWLRSASLSMADLKEYSSRIRIQTGASVYISASYLVINVVMPVTGWRKLQYLSEPPTTGAFNKLKYASEPPVSGAWNKLLYEGE